MLICDRKLKLSIRNYFVYFGNHVSYGVTDLLKENITYVLNDLKSL